MIIFLLFFIPLAAALVTEYLFCRCFRRRIWRYLPPALSALMVAVTLWSRWQNWNREGSGAPVETLLFFPGLPGVGLFLGLLLGWRVWKKLWTPRIIKEKKGR